MCEAALGVPLEDSKLKEKGKREEKAMGSWKGAGSPEAERASAF
jgi:hypothetical protein